MFFSWLLLNIYNITLTCISVNNLSRTFAVKDNTGILPGLLRRTPFSPTSVLTTSRSQKQSQV